MFAYLKGIAAYKNDQFAVVDVGGVGYKVFLSTVNLNAITAGDEVKLYTYLRVAEDAMDLYGFLTMEELEMFELLITVNGVGSKAAISILSSLSVSDVAKAIVTGDAKAITRAQGVGAKIAQRLILELKSKIKNESLVAEGPAVPLVSGATSEAVEALAALGYSVQEAERAVSAAGGPDDDTETLLKKALIALSKA